MIQTLGVCLSLLLVSATAKAALDIPKFFKASDAVFRGAQPEDSIDYDYLKSQGVKSILNLRQTRSAIRAEGKQAATRGIRYLSVPMRSFFSPGNKAVNKAYAFLTNPDNQPVFVHCRKGKDRTGLIIGLYRVFAQGWHPHDAYKEMRAFGFNPWLLGLEHMYWKRVKTAAPSEGLSREYSEGLSREYLEGLSREYDSILAQDDFSHSFDEAEDFLELDPLADNPPAGAVQKRQAAW